MTIENQITLFFYEIFTIIFSFYSFLRDFASATCNVRFVGEQTTLPILH